MQIAYITSYKWSIYTSSQFIQIVNLYKESIYTNSQFIKVVLQVSHVKSSV